MMHFVSGTLYIGLLLSCSYLFSNDLSIETRDQEFLRFAVKERLLDPLTQKLAIPDHIKHVKLDIGLSYNAPMSEQWLSNEEDLFVFGFEPNPASVSSFLSGRAIAHPGHGKPLQAKFIGSHFALFPCALGIHDESTIQFYVTKADCGCSSLYAPYTFEVEQVINVPIFPLTSFFSLFPFDRFPVIEYIKIDAQGSDLDIVKSAETYLSEHVLFITLEPENDYYLGTSNSAYEIDQYMSSIGFKRFFSPQTSDPTYLNLRLMDYLDTHQVQIYQKG